MNTRKIKEIIKFDVGKSIQNKWFVILNIVILLSILISTNWTHIENFLDAHDMNFTEMEDVKIQVLDEENLLFGELEKQVKDIEAISIEKVTENKYSKKNIPGDEIVLVEVKKDEAELIKIKIVSKEGITSEVYDLIYESVKESRNILFASKHNITEEELNVLSSEPAIERVYLGVDAENSELKEIIKTVSVVVVYVVLILVASSIANTIAQEKTSKSIEYVLTSVTAKEYLLAKVLGITLTILAQVLYTAIYYIIGNLISTIITVSSGGVMMATESGAVSGGVDLDIVKYILVMAAYLIFTVFFVGLVQATLSSKTNSISEAGNTTTLILFIVIALYLVSLGAITPYTNVSTFMYIISCIPIVSTFFVPAMMIIGQATTVQIIISFVILIFSVPIVFNICAKYFKNGILDYTTKKKSKNLFAKKEQELTLREKQEQELKIKFARKFSFTIGMGINLFVFVQMVLEIILSMSLPTLLKDTFDSNTILILISGLVSTISMIVATMFINSYNESNKEKVKKLDVRKIIDIVGVGIALIGLTQLALPYIYDFFGINYNILEKFEVLPGEGNLSKIVFFIVIAVLPAIFEELLCRKAILNSAKRYGKAFAVIFSALIFAIIHMNIGQAIFAFMMGIIFAIIAIKTNSIKIPILLHFLNNSYAALLTIFENNTLVSGLINNIVVGLLIFSFIILVKNISSIFKVKKEDFKITSDFKYIFKDYTFLVAISLMVVMFLATENILNLL